MSVGGALTSSTGLRPGLESNEKKSLPRIKLTKDPLTNPAGIGTKRFVDSDGRERVFHGTNVVVKGPPWVPTRGAFDRNSSMSSEDLEIMRKLGVRVVRLGVMWPGVEPERGQYNETYLDEIEALVNSAGEHGIYSLLDMHQDDLSEMFCGEGIPKWAVRAPPKPLLWGFPAPLARAFKDRDVQGFPSRQECATVTPWDLYQFTEEGSYAYDALYHNVDGIRDAWAQMWAKVASRFRGNTNVLGYEFINEPFLGSFYKDPKVLIPPFADKKGLQVAYDEISKAVREVDQETLVVFGGNIFDDTGPGFEHPPTGSEDNSVLAYHWYVFPQFEPAWIQFRFQLGAAERLKVGAMLTETGVGFEHFNTAGGVADAADRQLQSWAGWEWKPFCIESEDTLVGKSQNAAWGACKTGVGTVWPSDEGPPEKERQGYARTYAPAVAGEILEMYFESATGRFRLSFRLNTAIATPTELFVAPDVYYPNGLEVSAHDVSGQPSRDVEIRYDNAKDSNTILVVAKPGAEHDGVVHVSVEAKPAAEQNVEQSVA
ncbi:Endoglycoceramidase (EGCase) (Glycosphingolipid-specific enzyme) (GSL-specific enzyme) [Durusdinium trenchii]|uniref:Endoglycoceramidase (EGCase) (Glycosphingolipid-specific enzyme) (GSL-specific enzyme) n=1 Tax=Durusdinium trenchii TaxID=1381693 RepID=A0ABP0S2Q7_9DINO